MTQPVQIIYDGDCPFCASYVALTRLRAAAGRVELIDARSDHPAVAEATAIGLDLDEGMAMRMDGRWLHGDEVIHALALMTTGSGPFNALMAAVFRSPRRARALYPWLRAGRNAALALLGRDRIDNLGRGAGNTQRA